MFDTKSVFMYIMMFGVSIYLYVNVVAYMINKEFASYSIEELCKITIKYNKMKDSHYKLENYSFVLDVKRSLNILDEKSIRAHLLFDDTILMVIIMISLSILLVGSFGDPTYLVVFIGIVLINGIIVEMSMRSHKSEYDHNYKQMVQYIKDIYGTDVNGVLEDELVMYN